MAPHCASLPDGRLHFSHGPIDLVIQADGPLDAVNRAHADAWRRFVSVLPELVAELPLLRAPVTEACPPRGTVARRMWEACFPYRAGFITPMAAVAGAVAEEILACYRGPGIARASVNNGGDIAFHLSADASYRVGICTDIDAGTAEAAHGALETDGWIDIDTASPARGVATSGWKGRSFSLGIADSVTVLATTAAQADAAATVIANAVNVDDPRILRRPANELKDDTDLGALPVTVNVPPLGPALALRALIAGHARARELQEEGLIHAAVLACQGHMLQLGVGPAPAVPVSLRQRTNAVRALSY
ncbi:MAG TPA: UPF0280 family protein [Noviherbaspirillum sp.]|jgi:ApbE superfamily uncharacterized protein (UPF0280 family)|uniref:UPF0280 family protein n=1 Tax=Noviherbaspirillum sp. TaxID=1926288 RepID=UPI002F95743C